MISSGFLILLILLSLVTMIAAAVWASKNSSKESKGLKVFLTAIAIIVCIIITMLMSWGQEIDYSQGESYLITTVKYPDGTSSQFFLADNRAIPAFTYTNKSALILPDYTILYSFEYYPISKNGLINWSFCNKGTVRYKLILPTDEKYPELAKKIVKVNIKNEQ